MYIELICQYAKNNEYVHLQPPATASEISDAEERLKIKFPTELRELLLEMNGDKFLCFSVTEVVRNNLDTRSAFEEFTDLSCFLFIAGNGCGDYYGYRIEDRTVLPSPIYIWEHETFKAKVVANNLIEMIELYYRDKI